MIRLHRTHSQRRFLPVFILRCVRSCLLIFLLNCKPPIVAVHGWGQKGHEIVGNVASALLSRHALRQIEGLLNISSTNHTTNTVVSASSAPPRSMNQGCVEYCTPLAIVADWADQVRFYKKWSSPLHYIDVRDDVIQPNGCPVTEHFADIAANETLKEHYTKCSFNYTRDCPNDICVAGAIMNYTKQLYDGQHPPSTDHTHTQQKISPSSTALKESLMFLVHFMGDMHQPLHCSRTTDRGGNNIHVHYYHASDQNRFRPATAATRTSHIPLVTTTNPGSQQQHPPIIRPSIAVNTENANTALNSREYRPQRRHTSLSSSSSSHHSSLNLHAVWDDSIIETILQRDFQDSRNAFEVSLLLYIHDIRTNHPSIYNDVWLHCSDATNLQCVSTWGEESFDLAMQYAYANVDGNEIVDGATLDERYYLTRNPIVRTQLAIASVRLAVNLQQIFA